MKTVGRWQDDAAFCEWMITHKYGIDTPKGIQPHLSAGTVLYMYEAYLAGIGLADGSMMVLECVANEIDRREQLRRGCGDSRMAPQTASDVAAAIRSVLPVRSN